MNLKGVRNTQYTPLNCSGSTWVVTSVPTGSTASASTLRQRCPRKCPSKSYVFAKVAPDTELAGYPVNLLD